MRPRSLFWVIAVMAMAACDGRHNLGVNEDDLTTKCCYDVSTGQKASSCSGANCKCAPELCKQGQACQTVADCPQLAVPCRVCADGSTKCPSVDCINGQCVANVPACGGPSCKSDADCGAVPAVCELCADGSCRGYKSYCGDDAQCHVVKEPCSSQCSNTVCPAIACFAKCEFGTKKDPNGCDTCQCNDANAPTPAMGSDPTPAPSCVAPEVCEQCADGSYSCAQATCENGQCKVYFPPCPKPGSECKVDSDCPQPASPCQVCPDGSTACAKTWCSNGQCAGAFPGCSSKCPPPQPCAYCEYGFKTGPDGCQTCECNPAPTGSACKDDSECTTWTGCGNTCACYPLNKNQPVPLCAQTNCFVDPCMGKTAYCARSSGDPTGAGVCSLK